MTDKIACTRCGNMILPSTAERTGGLCMPCKNGTRARQDTSARMLREDLATRQTPEWKHLDWLNNAAHTSGQFKKLSRPNRLYLALRWFHWAMADGGLQNYFEGYGADYYAEAVIGLKEIGAEDWLRALEQAKASIFGDADIPKDFATRRSILSSCGRSLQGLTGGLDHEALLVRIHQFAQDNRLLEGL